MIVKTTGIVLHHFRYGDAGIILHFYSKEYGRLAFLVHGLKSKRTRITSSLFLPLTILEIEADLRENRELNYIRDAVVKIPLHQIQTQIIKSTLALFISELLFRTLREHEPNDLLFEFVQEFIITLEKCTEIPSSIHLLFIVRFTKFLGIIPLVELNRPVCYFDMVNGVFCNSIPEHPYYFNKELTQLLIYLLNNENDFNLKIPLNSEFRYLFLNQMIEYLKIHFQGIGEIKSHHILHELFE